ncbi:unnamed protein product [Toxocara canis]|uniref:Uncharacterized protein n=1 Tax=Toxocara canis TaxID=6265 RepID=A0A183UGL4_TOXCA|nr:unnamed protein product [Toxocara canis]
MEKLVLLVDPSLVSFLSPIYTERAPLPITPIGVIDDVESNPSTGGFGGSSGTGWSSSPAGSFGGSSASGWGAALRKSQPSTAAKFDNMGDVESSPSTGGFGGSSGTGWSSSPAGSFGGSSASGWGAALRKGQPSTAAKFDNMGGSMREDGDRRRMIRFTGWISQRE